MKTLGQILATLLLLGIIAGAGYGVYIAFEYMAAAIAAMQSQAASATAVWATVVLVAAWLLARAMRSRRRARSALAIKEEKSATYQLFLDYWANVLRADDHASAEAADRLLTLERLLALYGSGRVVRAHNAMRGVEAERGGAHADLRARFADALVAARQDMGTESPAGFSRDLECLLLPLAAAAQAPAEPAARASPLLAPNV